MGITKIGEFIWLITTVIMILMFHEQLLKFVIARFAGNDCKWLYRSAVPEFVREQSEVYLTVV